MTLARNSAQVVCTRLFKLGISLVAGALLARWLQPEGRGALSLITQFHLLAVSFGGMSIGHATIHFSGSERFTTDEQVGNAFSSGLFFSIITSLLIVLFQPILNRFFPFNYFIMLAVVFLVPVSMLDSYGRAVLLSIYRYKWLNALEMLQIFVFALGVIICFSFVKPRVEYAVTVWAGSLLVAFLALSIMVCKVSAVRLRFNRHIFRKHLLFGAKAHLSTVIGLLSLRFDQYILGALSSTSEVGKYAVAVSLAELLWLIPSSVSFVLLPKVAHEELASSAQQIKKACIWVLFISIASALLLAVVAKPLIMFGFGESYKDSIKALLILLPGMIAVSVSTVTTPFFLGKLGKPQLGALVAAVSLVLDIILNFTLIPKYGIFGASIASTISYVIATCINLALFYKYAYKRL